MCQAESSYTTSSQKNPGHHVYNELPRETALHVCCHKPLLGELRASWVTPLGEGLRSLLLVSLDFTPGVFPFADFVLYSSDVIYHSHEYDYLLSLVTCPSESLNLEGVLGTSKYTPHVASPKN